MLLYYLENQAKALTCSIALIPCLMYSRASREHKATRCHSHEFHEQKMSSFLTLSLHILHVAWLKEERKKMNPKKISQMDFLADNGLAFRQGFRAL